MICRLFGIHPKSIYKKAILSEPSFYKKEEDSDISEQIRPIINSRPSYGYKRVTTLLNKQRKILQLPGLNRKRVYRIMKIKGLLLPKTEVIRTHKKTGKVMTLHSNTRWCSDCFEIKCWNGEKVYVIFILDTCDRELIAYKALSRPIVLRDLQELMLSAVECCFSSTKAPRQIEFLSDRGSIYRSPSIQVYGRQLNLKSCFTAAYSPESNGMSEAFVKTIKRDYVYTNDCENAEKVISEISDWVEDYNSNAPHSALGMKSPREYLLTV